MANGKRICISKRYRRSRSRQVANCKRESLDPSDFGMEYIKRKDCNYYDDVCNCNDYFMQGNKDYCPEERNKNES